MKNPPPLLFLDFDGVINSHDWWERRKGLERERHPVHEIDPLAVARVERVCAETGAQVVVSSTWRLLNDTPSLRRLLRKRGFTGRVRGTTPDLRYSLSAGILPWTKIGRGLEIQWWLRTFLTVEQVCQARICILDDDSDMGDLLGALVQTRVQMGLTDVELPYIYKQLSVPLMDSQAAGGPGRVFFEHDALTMTPRGGAGPKRW